jgi:hypothetical protein
VTADDDRTTCESIAPRAPSGKVAATDSAEPSKRRQQRLQRAGGEPYPSGSGISRTAQGPEETTGDPGNP